MAEPASDDWPLVSVVMPVRNEADHLVDAVGAVVAQAYPGQLEVCLAVAPSTDDTEAIAARLAAADHRVSVVDNPAGVTPSGLNAAIAATAGQIVVRADGHSELSPGYVRRAVETLKRTGAANVGGVQRAAGTTPFEEAVAAAMASRFGVGDAKFHYGGAEGPTDTVYLGVFRRDALDEIGGFDEALIRNQDYELNWRLRQAGGVVWFDPELWAAYRPRGSVGALARQYYEYGWWKAEVVRRHPRSLRWRQVVAPVTVLAIAAGLLVVPRTRWGLLAPAAYGSGVAVASAAIGRSWPERARLGATFPSMHLPWGVGYLVNWCWRTLRPRRRPRLTDGLLHCRARPRTRS
ncbi:MAG: glycosyltransferase family 2 protein [Actinomycetota bacterium]